MATEGDEPALDGHPDGSRNSGANQGSAFLLQLNQRVRMIQFLHYVHANQAAFIGRERERLEQLVASEVMSRDEAEKRLAKIKVKAASSPPALPSQEEVAAAEFVERLLTRQGSRPPSFEALYQRKKPLDNSPNGDEPA